MSIIYDAAAWATAQEACELCLRSVGVGQVVWVVSVLDRDRYRTDPAQHLTAAAQDLDNLSVDYLSVDDLSVDDLSVNDLSEVDVSEDYVYLQIICLWLAYLYDICLQIICLQMIYLQTIDDLSLDYR